MKGYSRVVAMGGGARNVLNTIRYGIGRRRRADLEAFDAGHA
jgi:hypothetical protein